MSSPTHFYNFLTSSKTLNKLLKPKLLDIEGFRVGDLYMFYGLHKVSKTTICLDTALNAIKRGAKVLYVDGDMGGLNPVRINEVLHYRQDEQGIPKPLPNSVFKNPRRKIEEMFSQHLAKHGLRLYVAHSLDEFKKFPYQLTDSPHLVIVDSATLYFRQDQVLRTGTFGSGVKTVDFVTTTLRNYMMNSLVINRKLVPAPDGSACGIMTSQSLSDIGALVKQAELRNAEKTGIPISESKKGVKRPFVGGEGLGYLADVFLEIIHDATDPNGFRRMAVVRGGRTLVDKSSAYFKTCNKGITDV